MPRWLIALLSAIGCGRSEANREPGHAPAEPGARWEIEVRGSAGPDAGIGAAAAADEGRHRLLAFDWRGPSVLTWDWFDNTTAVIAADRAGPNGPGRVFLPAVGFDGRGHRLYVVGGWVAGAPLPSEATCRLDLDANPPQWERLPDDPAGPPARNGAAAASDPVAGGLWLFGGDGGPDARGFTPLGDLWFLSFESGRWSRVATTGRQPPARWHAATAIDAESRRMWLIGGAGLGREAHDRRLYELNLQTREWRVVAAGGQTPPSMQGATLTFDPAAGALIMIGGLRHEPPGSAISQQVWVFELSAGRWQSLPAGPLLPRRDHIAAFDAATGAIHILGGRRSQTVGDFYEDGEPVRVGAEVRVRRGGGG